jgi:hypothetical protein
LRPEKVRQAELTPTKTLVNAPGAALKKKLKNSKKRVGEWHCSGILCEIVNEASGEVGICDDPES